MRQRFIVLLIVAAVAERTTELPVGALDEIGILQEDLFPYLQRR
jgi:hypothetical protein